MYRGSSAVLSSLASPGFSVVLVQLAHLVHEVAGWQDSSAQVLLVQLACPSDSATADAGFDTSDNLTMRRSGDHSPVALRAPGILGDGAPNNNTLPLQLILFTGTNSHTIVLHFPAHGTRLG